MSDPGYQILLGVRRFGRNEHGIVTRDRADHAGPAAAIERQGHALRGADAGADHEQVRAGRRDAAQQARDGADLRVVAVTRRHFVAARGFDRAEFPEVANATRFNDAGRVLISVEDRRFYEERFFWADSTVFELFTIPFVQGDPQTALTEPNTVVLTEEMARKYFGDADPMGQTIQYDNRFDYEVTGVIRPIEANTHLAFDFLASFVTLPRSPAFRC